MQNFVSEFPISPKIYIILILYNLVKFKLKKFFKFIFSIFILDTFFSYLIHKDL